MSDSIDRYFDILSHRHRRAILQTLMEADEDAVAVSRLVGAVARVEENADRESVRVNLYHSHLPRLADAEVIEYDRRSETVRLRSVDNVETLLEWEPANG